MTRSTSLLVTLTHSRVWVEGQSALKQGVKKYTKRPGIRGTAIIWLTHDNFWGGIIITSASGRQLFMRFNTTGET
jgi:hypothetical protein